MRKDIIYRDCTMPGGYLPWRRWAAGETPPWRRNQCCDEKPDSSATSTTGISVRVRRARAGSRRRRHHPEHPPARLSKDQRVKGISLTSLVRRRWMVLVAVVVVAVAGFAVYRLHGAFGSHKNSSIASGVSNEIVPCTPKSVVYEVFGTPGATATINYQDVHAAPQRVDNAPLPWSYT